MTPELKIPASGKISRTRTRELELMGQIWRNKIPTLAQNARQEWGARGAVDGADPEGYGGFRYHDELYVCERERRIYRARTVAMLRRYMRYSIETGRLPSILGREFFERR